MNKKIPLLLFSALILVGGHLGNQNGIQASPDGFRVGIDGPALVSSFGEQLPAVIAGQQVMLDLKLNGSVEEGFVAIVEIRDSLDVTSEIIWKEGTLEANRPSDVRLAWKPQQAGDN